MHAFDLRDVRGSQIIVRRAHEGETMTTLDGKEHTLTSEMLVIADAEEPSCLAGVMGSLHSARSSRTPATSSSRPPSSAGTTSAAPPVPSGCGPNRAPALKRAPTSMAVAYAMDRALQLVQELDCRRYCRRRHRPSTTACRPFGRSYRPPSRDITGPCSASRFPPRRSLRSSTV